jgi:ArsR family transcriptional regulator, lead/cadmium/zinc/bismuth-responsive transcriptional repressor
VRESCDVLCLDLPLAEELRRRRLDPGRARAAAQKARALGDPTRLMLAAALAHADELCVCDLSWIAERPQNLVSHHLRALRAAGLVDCRRDGKMANYRLSDEGRRLLAAVVGADAALSA